MTQSDEWGDALRPLLRAFKELGIVCRKRKAGVLDWAYLNTDAANGASTVCFKGR